MSRSDLALCRNSVSKQSRLVAVAAILAAAGANPGYSQSANGTRRLDHAKDAATEEDDISRAADEWSAIRTAPLGVVLPGAIGAAYQAAQALPVKGGPWQEKTNRPYDSDDPHYRDVNISNSGGGSGLVSGRMTALAVDRTGAVVYAGAAGGGVWRSLDRGASWIPVGDQLPGIAVGAIAVNPADHSVWVGLGENNTAFENYRGSGVFRSTNQGTTWTRVGGIELDGGTTGALEFDGAGSVYAATSVGLWKHADSGGSTSWTKVLDAGALATPYGLSIVNDVRVRPGTNGQVVVANMAWRNGAAYNGFYISRAYGAPGTFALSSLNGAINPKSLGRSTLAYSADGSKLYAVVEDTFLFNKPNVQSGNSVLAGVYVSPSGDPAGPWNQIADYRKLQNSGSALKLSKGYAPGVQAWYNQFLAVDPADSQHVYVGLEEVFETRNGGSTWYTIGPYWNFGFACYAVNPDSCPKTTHPDQHAVAFDGTAVYVGNDGGVWRRPVNQDPARVDGWVDLNASLRTLQYYGVGAGSVAGGYALWGGMQDNGASVLFPTGPTMVSPFGGDGGESLVDSANGLRTVEEYVDLDMWLTTNAGNTDSSPTAWREISPSCFAFTYTPGPCDPNPRFIAPFVADHQNPDHWVAGGQYVWDNQGRGWSTACGAANCDWKIQYNTGTGRSVTALAASGAVTYAAWCGSFGCNPLASSTTGAGFERGLATNSGGAWHEVAGTLPNRYITGIALDPANPLHVFVSIGGFSRRWIPSESAGVGHVYESSNAGATWTDISGALPDAPAADVMLVGGKLVLAMDVGIFTASQSGGGWTWSQLGTGLPNAPTNRLALSPAGEVLAATHGRGIWAVAQP